MNSLGITMEPGTEVKIEGKPFICNAGFGMKENHSGTSIMGINPETGGVEYVNGMTIDVSQQEKPEPEPKPKKRSHKKKVEKIPETESAQEVMREFMTESESEPTPATE